MAKNRKTENAPNLIFIGDRNGLEPVRIVRRAGGRIEIRLPADQTKPFYCEDAISVARLMPRHYKLFD